MDEEDNTFGYFKKNDDDSYEDKDGNAGHDTIFFVNLVWEDIGDDIIIPEIPDHYCGPNCLK